jgi:hypothetical protein
MAKPNPFKSLGAPAPVGAPPSPPPGAGMGMGDGDADDSTSGGMLSPDTIGYHDDPHNCGNCKHDQNDTCELTGTPVNDQGGCMVWEGGASAGGGDQMASPEDMSSAMGGGSPAGGGTGMYGS